MKIDLNGAPRTAALVAKHEAETAMLPRDPDQLLMAQHAQRQILELLELCSRLERERFQ